MLYAAAVVAFILSILPFHHRGTGFTTLIDFGDQFYMRSLPAVRNVPHAVHLANSGYDGQFYAQLAVEPLLRNRALDVALDTPPYRARRILFAWTAWLAGLGRPNWVLNAFATQNIVAWLVLAGVLLHWFPPSRPRNVVPWLGCLFGCGMLASVRESLLEGPSLLVVTLAILAHERRRPWLATGLMAAAGLGRETNMVGSGLLFDRFPRTLREVMVAAGQLALVALPFLLWSLYVRSIYPSFLYSNPASFAGPAGYLTKWTTTLRQLERDGWHSFAGDNLLVLTGLTVQAVYIATRWEWKSAWWRMSVPYCGLLVITSYAVWTGHPGAAPRLLLPLAFAFNVSIAKLPGRWFWPLAVAGNLSVPVGISVLLSP